MLRKSTPIGVVLCLWALGLVSLAPTARAQVTINIVDGSTTWDWPSVGSFDTSDGTCTATLIGCRTVLTAAHCVCAPAGTGDPCPDGEPLIDPANYLVFLQNAGDQDPFSPSFTVFPVESVQVAPNYTFGVSSDLAVLELGFPVRGVRPAPINTSSTPLPGTASTIVGFGSTTFGGVDSGVKREGTATTGACTGTGVPAANHVCWTSTPETTCMGDSGGPLVANVGAGLTVAGVHSGSNDICISGSVAYDADVFLDHSWIEGAAGADLDATSCGDGPQVGDVQVTTDIFGGVVSSIANHSFTVAAETKVLRVALNAELGSTPNDFDLLLRFGSPPTPGNNDCFPELLGSFEYCEIADPTPGTWHVRVDVFDGGPGEYQVTATQLPENPAPPALGTGDLLVNDFGSWELMLVDGTTGDRTILSAPLRGSGPMLSAPEDLNVDASGTVVVANLADRSLLDIDLSTGDRTVISGCTDFPCGTVVGSGPEFLGPRFVALEASGDIVVADRFVPGVAAVVRVAPLSGNRDIVSGCDDDMCSSETGMGPSLDTPFGIAVDASGDIIVADTSGLVVIDPTNGTRTPLAGSGESFRMPADLEIEFGGDFLVVDGDPDAPAIFHVDADTGARTVISGCADASCNSPLIGAGPAFGEGLIGVHIDPAGDLLVTDGELGTVFHVDRNSGDRVVLSGCGDASCSSLAAVGSGPLFTNPVGIALPEPDTGLGLLAGIGLLGALRRRRRA